MEIAVEPQQTLQRVKLNNLQKLSRLGGLNFIYNAIKQSRSDSFIDEKLGYRNFRDHYSYSDIVLYLLGNSLCNGEYVSDLEYLKIQSAVLYKNPFS